eukprot:CAMPEP_0176471350 /NCGR_PEP_ID=MMETSP0127-20121128/41082_1 /TAXON_ID=938130 /ORGANISM="Platyophrya macrostoma, Strain WH" /LENGTH=449 /DNA_ID=CAMNT_0017865985 /DNA_START=27 /DNA_END=1376 /DNA_ORIENTATION=+
METHKCLKPFPCRLHPDENIQRFSLDESSTNPLLCIECIMGVQDKAERAKLIQLKDYVEKVTSHYIGMKDLCSGGEQPSSELVEFLGKEHEAVANLSAQIESEKEKVNSAFTQIIEIVTKQLEGKRTQLLKVLDDQILTLSFNYKTYKNKIDKFFKGVNENSHTNPESLHQLINSFKDTVEFETFMKSVNQDMAENAALLSADKDKAIQESKKGLEELAVVLKKQSVSVPTTLFKNPLSVEEYLKKITEKIDTVFEEAFTIENNIEQITGVSSLDSKILKKAGDISLLKKWISEKAKPTFKLIYRGSKDGYTASNFHSKCDNKGPTVVVIKSHLGKIFGGFTDVAWDSSNNYKTTTNSFLFSIDRKQKYEQKAGQTSNSIYAYATYGPTFGGGHDIYIADNCNSGTSCYSYFPYSYDCKEYSNPSSSDWLAGAYNFKVDEIEVFALGKK